MPRLSVWAIRLSLIYLALGFTLGGLLLWNKGLPLSPVLWMLLPAHIEALLFGWITQLILGVAFWILPRFSTAPRRGNEPLAWLALLLINLGILLSITSSLVRSPSLELFLPFLARAAQAGAVIAFAIHAWPRVKAAGV